MRGVTCAVVLLAVVIGLGSIAHAGKYKAYIETEPPGATVYFESTETSPVCKATPCTVDIPATETIVYIQLENYTPEIIALDPKKASRHKVVLKAAVGTLIVDGADGATVQINDEDKGKAPDKFELQEGGYHVVVTTKGGKVLYDDFVEVKAGEEVTVEPDGAGTEVGPDETDPEKPDDGGGITAPGSGRPHDRYLQASLVMDVGFRSFRYENDQSDEGVLLEASEGGQVLLGPMVEVWPTEILNLGKLRGLSLMGRVGFNVNPQPVTQEGTATGLTTFWLTVEALIRHRWNIGKIGIEVRGGYGRESYQFNGTDSEVAKVPDAIYQSVRIGARLVIKATDKIEPYLVAENRIVLSGGALEQRFMRGADASGLHAALGVQARFGPIAAKLEGTITRYAWTFQSDPSDTRRADGGTDLIGTVQVGVGYAY